MPDIPDAKRRELRELYAWFSRMTNALDFPEKIEPMLYALPALPDLLDAADELARAHEAHAEQLDEEARLRARVAALEVALWTREHELMALKASRGDE